MSIASEQQRCPKCGGPIPAEAPQGLCPKCLLAEVSIPTEAGQMSKAVPPSRDELAAAFPHLEILELIGQGGMGFVFKARQPKLDRFVALKILSQSLAADPAFAERFTREGRVLARLSHPNIVAIHDFGLANGFFYLLMEFVDGVNLRQAMRAGRFTPDQALAIVPKICEALQFAHNEGILHRDIKPENILIDIKGRVKIADFGIAKLIGDVQSDAHLTGSGATLGTPHYMAPEQIERPAAVDHRADIYSLGVVFYEMLTGELPLGRFALPSQKSASDPRLDDVVFRTLEKEPSRRPQSASEVKTQVETIAGSPPVATTVASANVRPFTKPHFSKRVAIVVLAVIAIPAGLICAWLLVYMLAHKKVDLKSEAKAESAPASTEQWAPSLAPGEKPDLQQILADAKKLADDGRHEEALQRHLWYHNHALEYGPSQVGVRLSFALSYWMNLAKHYPKAKQALIEIRDRGTREFASGGGSVALFMEASRINEQLREQNATYALFKSIQSRDPKLARQCYRVAEDLLVEKGDYALCASFIPNAQDRFEQIRIVRERTLAVADRTPEVNQTPLRKATEQTFIKDTRKLIEILVGVGRKAEAEQIRDQAVAVLNVPELQSAVADAEKKVAQNSASATPAKIESAPSVIPTTNMMRSLATRICEGDDAAFGELRLIATELYRNINYTTEQDRVLSNLFLMRAAFRELGEQAGRSNAQAMTALQSAAFNRQLKAHVSDALGIAAAAGNEQALDMLLHHQDWNMLQSSAVFALRAPAEKNNERAIDFLVAVLNKEGNRPLWYGASEGLKVAAADGNPKAKAALEKYEQTKTK